MQTLDPEDQRASSVLATLAVASLVLGILAILLSPFLVGGLMGLVGLALGIVQMTLGRARRALAVWGIALSALGLLASVGAGTVYYRMYRSHVSTTGEGGSRRSRHGETLKAWEGQAVPALSLTTVDGGTFDMQGLQGRPLVLNFWATWCKPCVEEIPDLNRLAGDVTVVGISDEPTETLREFMKTHPMRYTVISADDLPSPFDGIPAVPTTVFVGPDGVIRKAVVGGRRYAALKRLARSAEPPSQPEAPRP